MRAIGALKNTPIGGPPFARRLVSVDQARVELTACRDATGRVQISRAGVLRGRRHDGARQGWARSASAAPRPSSGATSPAKPDSRFRRTAGFPGRRPGADHHPQDHRKERRELLRNPGGDADQCPDLISGKGWDIGDSAQWLGAIFLAELARRRGESVAPVPPLQVEDFDAELGWLRAVADLYADASFAANDPSLLRLGSLLNHAARVIEVRSASTLQ